MSNKFAEECIRQQEERVKDYTELKTYQEKYKNDSSVHICVNTIIENMKHQQNTHYNILDAYRLCISQTKNEK